MDWKDIDRLRDPGFTVTRRGYDHREVDRLLGSLVDWLETDAAKELGALAFKRKLEFARKKLLMEGLLQSVGKEALTDDAMHKVYDEAVKQIGE